MEVTRRSARDTALRKGSPGHLGPAASYDHRVQPLRATRGPQPCRRPVGDAGRLVDSHTGPPSQRLGHHPGPGSRRACWARRGRKGLGRRPGVGNDSCGSLGPRSASHPVYSGHSAGRPAPEPAMIDAASKTCLSHSEGSGPLGIWFTGPVDPVSWTPPTSEDHNHELGRRATGDSEPAKTDAASQARPAPTEGTGPK